MKERYHTDKVKNELQFSLRFMELCRCTYILRLEKNNCYFFFALFTVFVADYFLNANLARTHCPFVASYID